MTRAMTIAALACFLVVGAAATSILGRDSVPVIRYVLASAPAADGPVSNKEGKQDRLAVAALTTAAFEPQQVVTDPALSESLRRAYASTAPADIGDPPGIDQLRVRGVLDAYDINARRRQSVGDIHVGA